MLLFAVLIVVVLCALPIAAAINIEIEKPLRKRGFGPEYLPQVPDDIMVLPPPQPSGTTRIDKKAA
jgi:hypothetical protein